VRRAGGVPVLLPPGETNLDQLLAALDGVVVVGGADIHPDYYDGNSQHAQLSPIIDAERDAFDLAISRKLADEKDRPALFICRGMQALNVALGGTLIEHIPDVRPDDIHRSEDGGWTVQPVTAKEGSLLATVMGTTKVATYSGHHQAAKDIAPGLEVVATAPDGIVEALGQSGHPWLIATQWHPEVSAAQDPSQQNIFDELVKAAAKRKMGNG
jgi:putative glutamine amidotransferase